MTQTFTDKDLITKVKQIEDTEVRTEILNILNNNNGVDTMNLNIDHIKADVQRGYTKYILGIKFVTYEDADTVLFTIKKDLRDYNVAKLFVSNTNTVEVILESNATLCVYYFLNREVYQEVMDTLKDLDVSVQIHND